MANVGRWETVVSSRAKKSGSLPKADRKRAIPALETMTKIEDLVHLQPVKETPTMFEAFSNVKDKRAKNQGSGDDAVSSKASPRPDGGGGKKKSEKSGKPTKPPTLAAAMKSLTPESLEKALSQSKRAFPNSTLLWLKDMASFLNVHFEEVPLEDPTHPNERADFPSSELPPGIKQLVVKTLQSTTNNVLEIFFHHCVQSMVTDLSKGLSIYGYQITAQLLAYMSPTNVLGDLAKFSEILCENQGRPLRCLAVLWVIGQSGHKDLATGIRVFFEIMFPSISTRHLAPFILAHFDLILNIHSKHLHMGTKSLGLTGYFTLLDFFNQSNPTCITSVEMRKLSKSILPKLKSMAYGADPSASLHTYFPSYLSRADTNGPLKGAYLSSLTTCLVQDPKSFSVWRELYTKHLPQSGALLKHLVECQGSKATEKIDKARLKETVKSFEVTNEELRGAGSKQDPVGLRLCEENCRPLHERTVSAIEESSAVGRGKKWLMRFLFLMLSFFALDIVIVAKGDAEESMTFRFLRDAGFSSQLDQVLANASHLQRVIREWVSVDLPFVYSRSVDLIAPYALLFQEYVYATLLFAGQLILVFFRQVAGAWESGMAFLDGQAPGWRESAEKSLSGTWNTGTHYARLFMTAVIDHLTEVWSVVITYSTNVKSTLEENESIAKWWAVSVETLQIAYDSVVIWLAKASEWLR